MANQLVPKLTEQMEERLEHKGADSLRMQIWTHLENKLMKNGYEVQDVLPKQTRGQTITYFAQLAEEVRLPGDKVFNAAALFDLACFRMGHSVAKKQLPELSSALVRMLMKMDSATCAMSCSHFVRRARDFAELLHSQGDMNTKLDIAMEDISKAEQTLAAALQWQFNIPSVQQWLQLLVTRLEELYPRATQHLEWVHRMTMLFAQQIVFNHTTYKEVFPQETAQGLFCTGLLLAGVLPVESFCPTGADKALWEVQWRNMQVWPGMVVPSSTQSLVAAEIAVHLVELVTNSPIQVLQTAIQRSIRLVWASVSIPRPASPNTITQNVVMQPRDVETGSSSSCL